MLHNSIDLANSLFLYYSFNSNYPIFLAIKVISNFHILRARLSMSVKSKSCGSLHCQRDSYARSLSSVVVSCEPSQAKDLEGKYEVVLEDTVLFPEGGGQVSNLLRMRDVNEAFKMLARDIFAACSSTA